MVEGGGFTALLMALFRDAARFFLSGRKAGIFYVKRSRRDVLCYLKRLVVTAYFPRGSKDDDDAAYAAFVIGLKSSQCKTRKMRMS